MSLRVKEYHFRFSRFSDIRVAKNTLKAVIVYKILNRLYLI